MEYVDESFDPAGHSMVDRIWEINYDENLRARDLNSLLRKPPAGSYVVRLKVKSKTGLWSDWFEQQLYVETNRPPLIRDFQVQPEKPAVGESLSFHYAYENEEWEPVPEERWSYQWQSQDGELRSGIGKPRAFFEPGRYQITLSLRDAYGNWSDPKTIEIEVLEREKRNEFSYKFSDPRPGEIIHNPKKGNYNDYPLNQSFQMTRLGPTLLFSNSPETVPGPGILYRDEVSGPIRVVYHHRNGSHTPLRLAVLVENAGQEAVKLTRTKSAFGGPAEDVMHLGQLVAFNYYRSAEKIEIMLPPGEKYVLYQSPGSGWSHNQSLTGMFDLQTDRPVRISILALSLEDTSFAQEELPIWPRDGRHARGTFSLADREVQILIKGDRKEKLVLGKDGEGFESWLTGRDALTGDLIINKGNYGAVYYLHFSSEEKIGILFNPRGLTFKGALQAFDGNPYRIPTLGSFYGLREAAVVGVLDPGQKASLVYTPPNGSDAPVVLAIIPAAFWDE
ncbi:MAG: PKD domain-containing protein [Bacillota bacterium]